MSKRTTLKDFFADMLKGGEGKEFLDATDFIVLARNEKRTACKVNATPEHMAAMLSSCINNSIEQMIKDDEIALANTLACTVTSESFETLKEHLPEDCNIKDTLAHTVNTLDVERMLAPTFMLITEDVFGDASCEVHNMDTGDMFAGFFATIEHMVDDNKVDKEDVIKVLNLALRRFIEK